MLRQLAAVALGSSLGGVSRYVVGLLVARWWTGDFPLATFLVNVSGSFALGLFYALTAEVAAVSPVLRLAFATGFVGAYTTFSTFAYETDRLVERGAWGWAALNVAASVVAGFLAVRLGAGLGR